MTPEQREELVRILESGDEISPEWARILFPPEKREYELVYHGKEREEDILADTMAVPLQPVRTFGKNGSDDEWRNLLIFGDNLQVMKSLVELKQSGKLSNSDGTPGVRLVYIDPVSWIAPPGKDRAVDIVAASDPLAAQIPRIKVQVKRLRSFMAVLSDGDVGIFVSVGGFTKAAAKAARTQEKTQDYSIG